MTINADYIEVTFGNEELLNDILPALLTQIGFDSFLEEETGLKGYIVKEQFDEAALKTLLQATPLTKDVSYTHKEHEKKNWNEEWEKDFDPVFIDGKVVIKAPFHTDIPAYPIEVLIEPKMSFGTGHHETTTLIIQSLLTMDLKAIELADIGCGTGVLGLTALKLGVQHVDGCDIDEWSFNNTGLNKVLNNEDRFHVHLGDVSTIIALNKTYQVVLANINKNILLGDLTAYADITSPMGTLILSGFYETDCGELIEAAAKVGFEHVATNSKNQWASLLFQKK